jgi:hypothetical protein
VIEIDGAVAPADAWWMAVSQSTRQRTCMKTGNIEAIVNSRTKGPEILMSMNRVVSPNWLVFRCAQNGLWRGATREHTRSGL